MIEIGDLVWIVTYSSGRPYTNLWKVLEITGDTVQVNRPCSTIFCSIGRCFRSKQQAIAAEIEAHSKTMAEQIRRLALLSNTLEDLRKILTESKDKNVVD